MTLTQQTRSRMVGIITEYRAKWNAAGVEAALVRTSQLHPDDDLLVLALAVAAARDPRALTPAAMHTRDNEPVAVTPRPTPRVTDPECAVCGSQFRRPDGACVGCWQNNATARPTSPVAPSLRPGVPPPADFRERVAVAAGTSVTANGRDVQQDTNETRGGNEKP